MSVSSLLVPGSVAIVGVSSSGGAFQVGGRAVLTHLRRHGYAGDIRLVTRRGEAVEGTPAVIAIRDLPHVPDCMLVAVPAADVLATVEEGLAFGVRAFVVVTGGFAEAGGAGAGLQRQLASMLREAGASMLGPNTTGFINVHRNIALSSTSRLAGDLPPAGPVGLVIQSGALGSGFLDQAVAEGIGISHLVSTGNQAVTGLAECVDFMVDDPATRVIALYVEAFQDFSAFILASRRAFDAGKPVVIYKAGRHESGRQAAAGHTGALVGGHDAFRAAAAQLGLCHVAQLEDLLPVAAWLTGPPLAGDRFAVLTVSGGLGGAAADALGGIGVRLPAPCADTAARLREHIPAFQSVANPIDCAGSPFRAPGGFGECVDALLADAAFDGLVIASTPIVEPWADEVVAALDTAGSDRPVAVVWQGEVFNAGAIAALRARGVHVFRRVDTLAAAVACALARRRFAAGSGRLHQEGRSWRPGARTLAGADVVLDEAVSKQRLREWGVAVPAEVMVPVAAMDEVPSSAEGVGYPVTVKGIAANVIHKTELGLVAVAVPDEAALTTVVQRMRERAGQAGVAFAGWLLAPTVRFEAELFAGVSLDPEFGPVMTVGAGGIHTEVMHDVSLRLLPLSRDEIGAMVDECRIGAIVRGARGCEPLDRDALLDLLESLASLGPRLGTNFRGVEVNPIALGRHGTGAHILDASVFE